MNSEALDYPGDYFRAFFQDDPGGWENGVRVVSESEIQSHMQSAHRISLTGDTSKNYALWLQARYEGFILCNTDWSTHESARFLVKMYLKQQKYALRDEIYFDHKSPGVKTERNLQVLLMQMSETSGVEVTIPSPYADMVLKTDLILEIPVSRNQSRKIAIQITTNSLEKENKFQSIRQFYWAHNGVKVCEDHEVDDVCLLFIRDGYKNFANICEYLVQVLKSFCHTWNRDEDCAREWGEIKIHNIKKQKISHNWKQGSPHTAIKPNDVVPVWASRQDTVMRLSLPFSLEDFTALQNMVADAVWDKNGIPWKRDERKVISYFDSGTEFSYFPGLVKIIQKWWKKWWILAQKIEKILIMHGRMSPDDYRKLRVLLLENSLDLPKREQKLQEIAEILERWFPGIYECIDCVLCTNWTAEQKKRLASYRKSQPKKPSPPIPPSPQPRQITPEQEARKRERDERRRAQSLAYKQRMEQEQIAFQQRIKAALGVESEINKKTEYSKMLKEVVRKLKQMFSPKEKITLKQVKTIESTMTAIMNVYKKCLELEQEEDGQKKILQYLDDFVRRFWTWGK